jgi:CRP/FNR family transcriptional regulator, cyclic AMP receptor protein
VTQKKDGGKALDPFAAAVPSAIASAGVGRRAAPGRDRPDHPLGRDDIELLAQVPLFVGLSRRHLKRLAEHADLAAFNERETMVQEGAAGGTFFVLVRGEAKVIQRSRTIAHLEPGDFFGEISLLDGGPRTASVIATTPVLAIRIFKRSFDKMVAAEPGVAAKILAVVARRLREAERPINA